MNSATGFLQSINPENRTTTESHLILETTFYKISTLIGLKVYFSKKEKQPVVS
jgi:hypothetical protein